MIILGPLSQGVRLLFTISFTVPAQYTADAGDAVITDTLPAGLSLDTEPGANNFVTINGGKLSDGVTFSKSGGTGGATCIIDYTKLSANAAVVVNFDTIISNSSLIKNTPIQNKSSLSFAGSSKFLSTGGTVEFVVTGADSIGYSAPDHAPFSTNSDIEIMLQFTASNTTEEFNYHVESIFGDNLTFDKTIENAVTASYLTGETVVPITGITITDPVIAGSNDYVFNFANLTGMASNVVTVLIKAKTNYPSTVPDSIQYQYGLTMGGTISPVKTQIIPVSIEVPLIKDVYTN